MNRKPCVAIVTPGAFPVPSGKSSSVEQVVEKLAERLAPRVATVVFGRATSFQRAAETRAGVSYRRVPYGNPRAYIARVSAKLAALRPTVIQVENRPRFAAYLRKRHPRAEITLSMHSTYYISRPHIGRKELAACLRCVDRVIVNSRFLQGWLARRVPGCAHKIVAQHLGVDANGFISRWTPEGQALREAKLRELGIGEDRRIVLYVGRLIPRKGVHLLLEAMPAIAEQHPQALLIVVGGAFYGSKRESGYVRKLHRTGNALRQHVRFVPYVPHQEVASWYRLADVAVVPSVKEEAFGLVNIEAMASGVPVVAARSGGIEEIIAHGTTGYMTTSGCPVTELAAYIVRLLADAELQRAMGEQAVRRVQSLFTWERLAAERAALYGVPDMPPL
ncbi:glycosyltransferase family 4 protein [Paenibacillus athensensis]|uniref:Glycosyl transferase family 1 n=1 Tax=Paenibacillus athensensis TaxID=1967502 RepID=A0A4Y8PY71_9BACL|nr:glycosyltransferase family 4 protein [Paenibacillus athensensis]MCD1258061.1 glycosyltransferase family 4 protein [Paenibacillus athensensis]